MEIRFENEEQKGKVRKERKKEVKEELKEKINN